MNELNISIEKIIDNSIIQNQGELFEYASECGLNSETFIRLFMTSQLARIMDREYSSIQLYDRTYLLEALIDEVGEIKHDGEVYSPLEMREIGEKYRYWHYKTGETSKHIYSQMKPNTRKAHRIMLLESDDDYAIEKLKDRFHENHN